MRISRVELHRFALDLVDPFRTANSTGAQRRGFLVRLCGDGVEGWGECVAETAPTYASEYIDGAYEVMRRFVLPALDRHRDWSTDTLAARLAGVRGHHMVKAALEAALLDVECRAHGVSLASALGATRTAVPAGVVVGITDTPEQTEAVARRYLAQGYRRIKVKIDRNHDVAYVAHLRAALGDEVTMCVDANASYTLADADHLAALDEFDLGFIEQPLAADDLLGHAELGRRLATPICLDESVTSPRVVDQAIALGACRVVNVKPAMVGGILAAVAVHDRCQRAGVDLWCGGMLETGIGRAANVAVAALAGFTLPGDLSASARYFATDLTEPFVLDAQGCLAVPTGPGLGVVPLTEVLERYRTGVEVIDRGL